MQHQHHRQQSSSYYKNDESEKPNRTSNQCYLRQCCSKFVKFKCHVQCLFGPLLKGKVWLIEKFEDSFECFGHYVFDHPWRFIIIPTLICLMFSFGFLLQVPELDMERLYSLPASLSAIAKGELNRVFPIERIEYIFASSENEGDLLTKFHLQHLEQFWYKVTRLKVPRVLANKAAVPGDISVMSNWLMENDPDLMNFEDTYSTPNSMTTERSEQDKREFIRLEDICIKDSDQKCKMTNPLELYSSPSLWGFPLRTTRYPILINFKTEKGYRIDSMLGGIVKEVKGSTTLVLNATAAQFRIDLNGNPDTKIESSAWEQALIVLIQNMNLPGIKLYVRADRSLGDELAQSCQLKGEDLYLLVCAAVFVFIFTVSMNSSLDRYRTKWLPATVGVISTLLAYGGGVGLCYLFGLKHVPPSESTPFILLGIGVDDIFVIANAYSLTYIHSSDSRTRIGLSFRDAGISITITTITNILAFAVGASSVYYSIRVFCIVTASGLLTGYLLCLTLFAAVLSLDAKNEQKYRSIPLWDECDISVSFPVRSDSKDGLQNQLFSNMNRSSIELSKQSSSLDFEGTTDQINECCSESPSTASTSKIPEDEDEEESPSKNPSRMPENSSALPYSSALNLQFAQNLSPRELKTERLMVRNPISYRKGQKSIKPVAYEERNLLPFGVESGFFCVEELDGHLVVAERVAHMYEEKQKKKNAQRTLKSEQDSNNKKSMNQTIDSNNANRTEVYNSHNSIDVSPYHSSLLNHIIHSQHQSQHQSECHNQNTSVLQEEPIHKFDLSTIPRLVQVQQRLIPIETLSFEEPPSTVGQFPRYFFMHYYGPFLMQPIVKGIVLLIFLSLLIFSCYEALKVEAGLKVREITPYQSYLRSFYDIREKYFSAYGDEYVVFFPYGGRWWDSDVQDGILQLTESIRSSDHVVFVFNGFEDLMTFIKSSNSSTIQNSNLPNKIERQQQFMTSLTEFMETPRGMIYKTMFTIEDGVLTSWKFYYWTRFQDNTLVAIHWLQEVQSFLKEFWNSELFKGYAFTPLAVMWESDPVILRSTIGNMTVALISMGIVASLLVPDLRSGLLVLLIIVIIDIDVYGFMSVWGLNLNMLTMVNLVLSIGFAVDYTAHITHCFNHCKGKTRNRRMIETLLLMGLPVTEGMISTYAAVSVLSFSSKYALVVVFRMTTSVMTLAFIHGIVLMPIILSLIGPMDPREVEIVEIHNGKIESTLTVDGLTGKVLSHLIHYTNRIDRRRDWMNHASVVSRVGSFST